MVDKDRLLEVIKKTDSGCAIYYDILPSLINERGYKTGVEIGVFTGGHASSILLNSNLELLIGIDPYVMFEQNPWGMESQEDYDFMYDYVFEKLSKTLRYDHLRLTSDDAYPLLEADMFDFVFIDGLHTYEQLKKDLTNYDKIIRTEGIISCHDYKHPNFPLLTLAIDEFAMLHGATIIEKQFHFIYMEKTW
jgi:hypothetical protein